MLNLLLTFDYELFFNESFCSEEEVLISPAYELATCMESNGVQGSFFIDTPSIIAYERHGMYEYPAMVKRQVQYFLDHGHDIQLHLHPTWETADVKAGKWCFNQEDYSLSAFDNISEIVGAAKHKLDELAGGCLNYNCKAFRAGGFCIQPEKEIVKALLQQGIKIDSSVCKNSEMHCIGQEYDFKRMPKETNWYFEAEKGLRCSIGEQSEKAMFEIPIGSYSKAPYKYILTRVMSRNMHYPPYNGKPSPTIPIYQRKGLGRYYSRLIMSWNNPVIFSLDSLHEKALFKIMESYIHSNECKEKDVYICAIGHPKFTSHESVQTLDRFIKLVKEKYSDICFCTMKDVAERMQL